MYCGNVMQRLNAVDRVCIAALFSHVIPMIERYITYLMT